MTLIHSAEQLELAGVIKRFVAEVVPLSRVRATLDAGQPFDPGVWRRLGSELQIAGLAIPAEYGGADGTWSDMLVVLRELGAGLVPSPLLASGVLAAGALLAMDDEEARKTWLPGIAAGETIATLATAEAGTDGRLPAHCGVRASAGRLTGTKIAVPNAAQADVLLVTADDGIHLIEAGVAGLEITPDRSFDPTRDLATVRFDSVPARRIDGDHVAALDRLAGLVDVALAAEQVGALRSCLESITGYAKIRYSFGLPIGAYQGVKHKLADMYCELSLADAQLRLAGEALAGDSPAFPVAACEARLLASTAYVQGAKASMTLHGGIGYTWEHDAHLFYRNAVSGNVLFGDPLDRLDRLVRYLEM